MLFQEVTLVSISGAFIFGMLLVMLSSIRPAIAKRLGLSEGSADWLIATFNLALIPMMLVSGLAVDHWGAQIATLAGSIISCLGLFILARAETYLRAQGAILLLGAGGAFLSTASSVLMLKAFFPENEAASQNMGNVFFGIGALVAPALTATLLDRLGYARGLMFLAIAALVPALAAALTAREAFVFDGAHGSLGDVLSRPVFWIAAIVFLLYGPLEGSLGFWATRYLTGIGFRERISQLLLTLFWLSFLTARLVTALVQKDWARRFPSHGWIIIVLALAAAVAVGNMAGARTRLSAAIGFLLVGAFLGPIFPSLVAVLFGIFDRERGTAYGAMFSIGAAGSLVLPPVIGIYARRTTLQRAMRIPVILALFLALAALVLAVIQPGR